MSKEVAKASKSSLAVGSGAELERFEEALTTAMERLGLPSTDVLVSFEQRYRVLMNFDGALADLDADRRARSMYLSKFMVAVGAGLFDAALNYLWDETISELRRRVIGYDLDYFFDIAVASPDRRKQLKSEDDLVKVDDFDLIRASNELGLVSDVGHKQLDLIRYMRNFASAAHPNQNDIGPMQLLGWVETCIREVITLPESTVVAETKRLLVNVKTTKLTVESAREVSSFFDDLRTEQADNLGAGLFGIYTGLDADVTTRDNVRLLFPGLWDLLSEAQKQQFGLKYGRFAANGDQVQADLARELLDSVDALAYLPEPVRVNDIVTAVEDLLRAHRGWDNFHAEPSRARVLQNVVGSVAVPEAVRVDYVLGVIEPFLTNGHGVAWSADPIYVQLIENFTSREAEIALLCFKETRIASRLQLPRCAEKFGELLDLIEPKLARRRYKEILTAIRDFTGPLDGLPKDSNMKRLVKALAE